MNSWVINYVACFTFDVIVCPAAVKAQRDSSLCGYPSPPIREDYISLLGDDASLIGGYGYPQRDEYLGVLTAAGQTSTSKVKQAT